MIDTTATVRALRAERGFTHLGFSKASGLTVNTIWRLENDPKALLGAKVSTLMGCALAFEMTPGEFLDYLLANS